MTDPLAGLIDASLDPIFWPAERLGVASAWWPHVPFGHWVASVARPRVLVELGTGAGAGVSYSAFCQAVARESLGTRCYAIDNWRGGSDAKVCSEELFDDLTRFHDERFSTFSTLLRSSFDGALSHFADRTVDLLHIEGLHAYEAIRHNFESWKPKLSGRAVALLHNTNMHHSDVGVWRLWNELCQQYPNFEFLHGNGLGVLAVGADAPPAIVALCGIGDLSSAASVRNRFASAGERWLCNAQKTTLAQSHSRSIAAARAETEQARAEVRAWEKRAKEEARAREQIALRIGAARRDLYEANLRAEQAVGRAEQAEATAALAVGRAEQAEATAALAVGRAQQSEDAVASVRTKLEQVVRERDALLSSTIWRATAPLRTGARAFQSVFSAKRLGRFEDILALLPLPNLFMQNDVLFIGYIEAALGLGESLRGLVRSVATSKFPFALYPFRLGVETRLIGPFMEDSYDLKHRHKVNVIEMAVDQLPAMFREIGRWKTVHSYNILRTYWELPQAPAEWASLLKSIHEIWAPSEFVARAFRGIFDGPISIVPPCVEIEMNLEYAEDHFGLKQDRFYFMFSFDYFSYPARKNPLGVVRAFQAAFPDRTDNVGLIVKSTSAHDHYPNIKSSILEAARKDRRIEVIDRMFSRDEMLSLIRRTDCYISLHRSEGFGLGMAEAMAFGKPVIGTDFSGNTDYLSNHTGFPVSFTLRPVEHGEYSFSDGQVWAEPDEAVATEAMRNVLHNLQERQRRAAAGKAFVEARYGRKNVGQMASRRLQDILSTR
jgi:glycosyltransferase involved in cell wall biosynthesis